LSNVLGLDLSTTTIGYTIVNENGIVLMDFVKPKGNTIFEKMDSGSQQLIAKIGKVKVDKIMAEQPNIMFQQGKSSAQTISKILRFNGAILFTLHRYFRIFPDEIMSVSARKQVIGRGRFDKGLNPKEEVFKFVASRVPEETWINCISKTGKWKPERFDVADSYIIAMAGLNGRTQATEVRDTD